MRLLGVDFGFARIGLAVGESEHNIMSPRPALVASGTLKRDAEAIAQLAKREAVDRIVLGLPLEDGEEGKMSRICRKVGELLAGHGLEVGYVDETLSSVQAEQNMFDAGLKASVRKKRRDGEAAGLILERYVNEVLHASQPQPVSQDDDETA